MGLLDDMIENAKKQLIELEKGGNDLVYKKIEEWKKNEGVKPMLDTDVLKLHIIMLQSPMDPKNPQTLLLTNMWNTLLAKSFEAKLLEYELNFKK